MLNRLFVDNLTVLDFSYFHPRRGVVGESWIVDVELLGELNDEGMVFDFGHVKKLLKAALDGGMDHTLVVPEQLPGLSVEHLELNDEIRIAYQVQDEVQFAYQGPRDSVFLIDSDKVSIDSARPLLENHLNSLVPSNVKQVKLNLRAEEIVGALYHYSHGLKKHLGDCQRICHGHRSKIIVLKDGQRDLQVEADIAEKFHDIYLITDEDILSSAPYDHLMHVGYEAEQGRFDVWLNPAQCYTMHTDTTVELIATHLCDLIKNEFPNHEWTVRAFEGVGKGAIALSD
ncbi:6-carboxytetrahydropterin synthase [Reinekea marina]|uniref:6-carboxy-5,6,7,8-tetrahydropterin synthase n=1 Tax=Reinekea marina TaxID=1310421 RepID=A0ABV7WQ96_9GAMM|nr:6-carboxytetrahydropterin synthase [Reinekea marina]MDN3650434.1 6-carboxytetrahydropterin synthase [Reinekea marina]